MFIFPKRNFFNKYKFLKLEDFKEPQSEPGHVKPRGIWYSLYNKWYIFMKYNNMISTRNSYKYLYKLNLKTKLFCSMKEKPDIDKIILLNTGNDLNLFVKKYEVKVKNKHSARHQALINKYKFNQPEFIRYINWNKVKLDYGGIEFILNKSTIEQVHELDNTSLTDFSISSGCIWNVKLIESISNVTTLSVIVAKDTRDYNIEHYPSSFIT